MRRTKKGPDNPSQPEEGIGRLVSASTEVLEEEQTQRDEHVLSLYLLGDPAGDLR